MKLAKVRKLPADLQAVHTLREAIISGAIAQGERITESELASQMAVSRATIRSALQQLASEGLTTLKRYSGWSVLTLSADDVQELYNLRSALERLVNT
jgi:DNA-binding GntR family transcriptional regulator